MSILFNFTGEETTGICVINFNYTQYYSENISNNTNTLVTIGTVPTIVNGSLNITCMNGQTLYNITTDFIAPNIFNFSSNATSDRVNNVNMSINITIEYVEIYIDYVTISSNGTYNLLNFTCSSGNCTLITNWSMLGCLSTASSCELTAKIVDKSDANDWETYTLYRNASLPTISAMNWSDTDYISNGTTNYVINVSYTASWLNNVTVTNFTGNKSTVMSCSSGYCTLTTNLSHLGYDTDGSHSINATVYDVFGNSTSTNINVTLDNTFPVVNNTLYSNNTNNWYVYNEALRLIVNVSDTNMYMCDVQGLQMSNNTIGGETQNWTLVNTTSNIRDCSMNCTYCRIAGNCTDKAGNSVVYGLNITVIPCVGRRNSTGRIVISSSSCTSNTLTFVLNDSITSEVEVWMIPQSYNTTHGQCNYNASNVLRTVVNNVTVNLTYTSAAGGRCNMSIYRNDTDTGAIIASVHATSSITQPSSIPAAAIGALALIVFFSHLAATKTSR